MIARIWLVASREALENRRQPVMLLTMTALFVLICTAMLTGLWMLEGIHHQPEGDRVLRYWAELAGAPSASSSADLATFLTLGLQLLCFSQLLGMTAVIAGHLGIHDKLCGTLPFLLLSPIRRGELLTGKILGALVWPFLIYLILGLSSSGVAVTFDVTHQATAYLPTSPAWWVGYLWSTPAWTLWIATLCVLASLHAPDVRTAQQVSWFIVFFATMLLGPLLVNTLPAGPTFQFSLGVAGLLLTAGTLAAGTLRLEQAARGP